MEKLPLIQQVPELCPKCRPFTLGVGGRKKVRGFEIPFNTQSGGLKDQQKGQGWRGGKSRNEGRAVEGDEADGNEDEDDDEIRKTDHEEGEGKAKRVELDPRTIPSVENGSSEIPASRFSVFRRVLGVMIPGSSTSPPIDKPSTSESSSRVENIDHMTEKEMDDRVKGKANDKQSWHKAHHDPDWEIVGREKS